MSSLESLLNDLANLDAQHDLDGVRRLREEIVVAFPESEAAVEAQYRIGLDFLFRQRDLMAAVEAFGAAAKRKHPYWSAAARTSLGLCLYHQKRTQKALFELRKVAYPESPNLHSVTALTFLENIFTEEGKPAEVKKVRGDKIGQLDKLVKTSRRSGGDLGERGYFLFQLGMAHFDDGDVKTGRAMLDEAKELGEDLLGEDLYRSVIDALR